MRILSKKNLLFLSIIYFGGVTISSAQDTLKTTAVDSIVNKFIPQTIELKPQEATVTINEDPRIQKLLDIKAKMDKDGEFSDRYKIQLYNGNLNEAQEILKKAEATFPQWNTEIKWETPNYKVWIGNYRSKLETDRALKEIKKEFSDAFSFKP